MNRAFQTHDNWYLPRRRGWKLRCLFGFHRECFCGESNRYRTIVNRICLDCGKLLYSRTSSNRWGIR